MTTIDLDFVVIKDTRGYEGGFFWSDVQQIIGVYDEARTSWSDDHQVIGTHKEVDESVKVKFRHDADDVYTLIFVMSVKEFLEQVEKQLNHPSRLYSDDKEFPLPQDTVYASFDDIEDGTTKEK